MLSSCLALLFAAAALPVSFAEFAGVNYPNMINAGSWFQVSVSGGGSTLYSPYRVYLATTPSGYAGGPSCLLTNTTSIETENLTLMIPSDLGPNANDYSILVREFSSDGTPGVWTNGTEFTLTGSAIADYSEYEKHLNGAALWPSDDLPCSSYACARTCATASYPGDLNYSSDAYATMAKCVMQCPGVAEKTPAQSSSMGMAMTASKTASSTLSTATNGAATPTKASNDAATSSGAASSLRWRAPLLVAGGALALIV